MEIRRDSNVFLLRGKITKGRAAIRHINATRKTGLCFYEGTCGLVIVKVMETSRNAAAVGNKA